MKFSLGVIGPDFDEADIVVFDFLDSEVSFSLPKHRGRYDAVLAPQNLTDINDFSGRSRKHPFGYIFRTLVRQSWLYDDEKSENEVVLCDFTVQHVELLPDQIEASQHLSESDLSNWLMMFLRLSAVKGRVDDLGTEVEESAMREQRKPLSIDEFEYVERNPINWPIVTVGTSSADVPEWRVYIPVNSSSLLEVSCDIGVVSSDHDSITIPKPELDQLRKDIRDEILGNISVTYSPEFSGLLEHS